MPAKRKAPSDSSTATIGFEAKEPVQPDLAADKLHNNTNAAVTERSDKRRQPPEPYKHVVLGLIFLKYLSDTFEEHRFMRRVNP